MKPLHGFLQDSRFYEDVGHVVLGVLPIGLLLWAREWTKWRMPWPMSGQYPPGDPITIDSEPLTVYYNAWPSLNGNTSIQWYAELSRVSDVGRDELGYRIGATIRNVGLLVWWAI